MERRLAAIFAADVEGYSRLMAEDEVGTMETLTSHRAILDGLIAEHRGRIANTAGDSVLAEFPSAVDAVTCALQAQAALASANDKLPERRLQFRIGVHVGDVMVKGGDLFGDGVNIAARLQALSRPGRRLRVGDSPGVCPQDPTGHLPGSRIAAREEHRGAGPGFRRQIVRRAGGSGPNLHPARKSSAPTGPPWRCCRSPT